MGNRSKCREQIDFFYAKKYQVTRPNIDAIKGPLMAFVPAWVSKIPGLANPFEPIAIQDYGKRDACDRYIVVIGRPLYAVSDPNAKWSMYFFCYYEITFSLALTSSVELPHTENFRFVKMYDKKPNVAQTSKLVSEIFLPPLAPAGSDLGSLVVVYWEPIQIDGDDRSAQTNAIFELYVDNSGTVHTGWLLRSGLVTSDNICSNLSPAIRSAFGLDSNTFTFISEMERKSYFKKIAVIPKNHPPNTQNDIVYSVIGVIAVQVEDAGESMTSIGIIQPRRKSVDLEFLLTRRQNDNSRSSVCSVTAKSTETAAPDARDDLRIYTLLFEKVVRQKQLLFSGTNGQLLLITTGEDTNRVQELRSYTQAANEKNKMNEALFFAVSAEYSAILQPEFASQNVLIRSVLYSSYSGAFSSTYIGTIMSFNTELLRSAGANTVVDLVVFTAMQSNIKFTSQADDFIREYAMTLPDANAVRLYLNVSNVPVNTPTLASGTALTFTMETGTGLAHTLNVQIDEKCDYMNCKACRTRSLKGACNAAQTCATVNCVGTVINPNNILCVLGTLLKETTDIYTSNADTTWFTVVELTMSVLQLSKVTGQKNVVYIESVSNLINTGFCESKDILATLSAVFPSLIFSIYVAASGNTNGEASNFDIQNPQQAQVKQIFSPGIQLKNAAMISSITQVIYQVSLSILHATSASSKLAICGISKLAEFSGGYIDIIDHDIDRKGIDYCSTSVSSQEGTTAETDEQIIRSRIAVGAIDDSTVTVKLGRQSIRAGSFVVDRAKSIVWAINYRYVTAFIYINAIFDTILGILYGLSRLITVFEEDDCKPRPAQFSSVLNCVCGDLSYAVSEKNRVGTEADGALWCTGVLKMVNMDGDTKYVSNPFSLHELAADLHVSGQAYIDCISKYNAATCEPQRLAVYLDKYEIFSQQHVSPLAVLGRCRDNYNAKTWDEGLFGVYDPQLRTAIVHSRQIGTRDLNAIETRVDAFLRESTNAGAVHTCLSQGPNRNRIQGCMTMAFSHLNLLAMQTMTSSTIPEDYSVGAYFTYELIDTKTHGAIANTNDACEYLSSQSFAADPEVVKCRGSSMDVCGFTGKAASDICRIGQSTFSYEQSIQTNIIDEFQITGNTIFTPLKQADTDNKVAGYYAQISACTTDYIEDVKREILPRLDSIVNELDLTLVTGEGDLLHQFVDCMFLGADNSTFLAPADTSDVMQTLMYSRSVNATDRLFELPCNGSFVYDRWQPQNEPFRQKTCGSDTRISVMAYVTQEILYKEGSGLHLILTKLISEKITAIAQSITNVSNYGCLGRMTFASWQNCCERIGNCMPFENTFEPNLPEVDYVISTESLLAEVQNSIGDIGLSSIIDNQVHFDFLYTQKMHAIAGVGGEGDREGV